MTTRVKTIRICLSVVVIFPLLLGPVWFHYYVLASADFISRDPKLEAFDQDLLGGSYDKFAIAGMTGSDYVLLPDPVDFKHPLTLSSQTSPFDQRTSILRC